MLSMDGGNSVAPVADKGRPRVKLPPRLPSISERFVLVSLAIVVVAVFGPYTPIAGSRTEQLAVYGCLVLTLLLSWPRFRVSQDGLVFLVLWSVYIAVALIGVVTPVKAAPWGPRSLLAGTDNLLRPVAVFVLVTLWLTTRTNREIMLRLACQIVIGAMCLNAVVALIESRVDITALLSPFWSSVTQNVGTATVAGRAAQLGRMTGILNQPVEAGTLYGIAMLAAIFLWRERPWRLVSVLILLAAGGTLTVSKIFLFVALPIAAWHFTRLKKGRIARFKAVLSAALAFSIIAVTGFLPKWLGTSYLLRLAAPGGNYLWFFSAGRFGSGSTILPVAKAILLMSPVIGFGLRGLAVPYDNGWIEALVFAGLIGVAVYSAVLLILFHAWWARRRHLSKAESMFAGGLVLLTTGASLGFPALTGNRVATVLWVLLTIMLLPPPAAVEISVRDPIQLSRTTPVTF